MAKHAVKVNNIRKKLFAVTQIKLLKGMSFCDHSMQMTSSTSKVATQPGISQEMNEGLGTRKSHEGNTQDDNSNNSTERRSSDNRVTKSCITGNDTAEDEKQRRLLLEEFRSKEVKLKEKLILYDKEPWMNELDLKGPKSCKLLRVGGLDISFHINKSNVACVSLVVLSFPKLEVVYEDTSEVEMDVPYISSYLGYREVKHFRSKLDKVRGTTHEPQIVLIDGNGLLHPRRFGSACLLGVTCDVPAVGVAKNLLKIPEEGIENSKIEVDTSSEPGTTWNITTNSGDILAKAVTVCGVKNPVYVSIGNKCSLKTAVNIVVSCSKFRIPEPIRQADMRSRKYLREKYKDDYQLHYQNKQ